MDSLREAFMLITHFGGSPGAMVAFGITLTLLFAAWVARPPSPSVTGSAWHWLDRFHTHRSLRDDPVPVTTEWQELIRARQQRPVEVLLLTAVIALMVAFFAIALTLTGTVAKESTIRCSGDDGQEVMYTICFEREATGEWVHWNRTDPQHPYIDGTAPAYMQPITNGKGRGR